MVKRFLLQFFVALTVFTTSVQACQLVPFRRDPTIAEQVAGLDKLFSGTVIGYVTRDGDQLFGPIPSQCNDDDGRFYWWSDRLPPECEIYLDTVGALFNVDVAIVGPAVNEVATYGMIWGGGDCNIDFKIGEKWLIAGFWYTQELRAPVRESEVALLRSLASRPAFDFKRLYR